MWILIIDIYKVDSNFQTSFLSSWHLYKNKKRHHIEAKTTQYLLPLYLIRRLEKKEDRVKQEIIIVFIMLV